MTPRKQSKRMWGVFNDGDCIASFERREVARNWKTSREIVRPVTTNYTPPNPKRKAKRT